MRIAKTWRVSRKSTKTWRLLKMTNRPRLQAREYAPAATVKQSSLLANVVNTAESNANSKSKALHLKKSTDETGSAFLSPVRSASMQNNVQNTRKNLGNAGIKLTCYKGTAF